MAKKKSPGTLRIKSADPSKLPPRARELSQAWRELEKLHMEAYRIVLPNLPAEIVAAVQAGDRQQLAAIQKWADLEWTESLNVRPLTSLDNLQLVMREVSAAGYKADEAGLYAWTMAKLKTKPIDLLEFDEIVTLSGVSKKTVQSVISPTSPTVDVSACAVMRGGVVFPLQIASSQAAGDG